MEELKVGSKLAIDWDKPINHGKSALSTKMIVVNKIDIPDKPSVYQVAWFGHKTPFDSELVEKKLIYLDTNTYTAEQLFEWLKVDE